MGKRPMGIHQYSLVNALQSQCKKDENCDEDGSSIQAANQYLIVTLLPLCLVSEKEKSKHETID